MPKFLSVTTSSSEKRNFSLRNVFFSLFFNVSTLEKTILINQWFNTASKSPHQMWSSEFILRGPWNWEKRKPSARWCQWQKPGCSWARYCYKALWARGLGPQIRAPTTTVYGNQVYQRLGLKKDGHPMGNLSKIRHRPMPILRSQHVGKAQCVSQRAI